jgi:hypothetical protein
MVLLSDGSDGSDGEMELTAKALTLPFYNTGSCQSKEPK